MEFRIINPKPVKKDNLVDVILIALTGIFSVVFSLILFILILLLFTDFPFATNLTHLSADHFDNPSNFKINNQTIHYKLSTIHYLSREARMNNTFTTYGDNGHTGAQIEIQQLLKKKEGWSLSQLARKAGESPQTTHNHLYANSNLKAEDYLKYKRILTGSEGLPAISISAMKEKCFEIIDLEMQMEKDFDNFCRHDLVIDIDELQALKTRRNVIVQRLDKFIGLVEQHVNETLVKQEARSKKREVER